MLDSLFRKLPVFSGKNSVARLLFKQQIKDLTDVSVNGKFFCKYLLPNLQENVGFDIFVNGIYEESTVRFLQKIIPPNGKLLDLGANIGAILIPLSKLRKDIHVLAVEAAPWVFEYLKKNITLNSAEKVQICNYALFEADDLEMDFFSPQTKFGKGSFSPVFTDEVIRVTTRKVDTLIKEHAFLHPSTLKVDVEGFEYFVFKGAEELLGSSSPPDIIFEFVDWAEHAAMGGVGHAQRYLLQRGYKLYTLEEEKPVRIENVIEQGSMNLFASVA